MTFWEFPQRQMKTRSSVRIESLRSSTIRTRTKRPAHKKNSRKYRWHTKCFPIQKSESATTNTVKRASTMRCKEWTLRISSHTFSAEGGVSEASQSQRISCTSSQCHSKRSTQERSQNSRLRGTASAANAMDAGRTNQVLMRHARTVMEQVFKMSRDSLDRCSFSKCRFNVLDATERELHASRKTDARDATEDKCSKRRKFLKCTLTRAQQRVIM
mmetsp:Transcript_6707/g.10156  ORF Transcript_6707/g.10156 Transcript_6707/m.10156 type:complete len:215 (-) Transcript_6707:656-1300(-)